MAERPQSTFSWAPPPKPTLTEQAHALVEKHPYVLDTFIRLARERRDCTGTKRVGAKAIIEQMRWELRVRTEDGTPYRLNNSLVSPLVRIACHVAPDIAHLFETRTRRRK